MVAQFIGQRSEQRFPACLGNNGVVDLQKHFISRRGVPSHRRASIVLLARKLMSLYYRIRPENQAQYSAQRRMLGTKFFVIGNA